jgi:(S)-sulfolactate dehydrogenase
MPQIVVTEFLDPGPLEALRARYSVHLDTALWNKRAELEALAADAIALIVRNRTQVDAALISKAANLKAVGRLGVGLDNIDVAACKARNIAVCPAIGANAVSVAEYVIASALLLSRMAGFSATAALMRGEWPREAAGNGGEITGMRLGIVGYGSIGQVVAGRARGIGMSICAHDEFLPADNPAWSGVARQSLDELLATSDVVTLHCPLTPQTKGLIGERQLARMKPGAFLVNTARGGIVDEAALAASLRAGHLGGAALDVFGVEPIDGATASVFAGVPNLILTPHVAGVTRQSNARISAVTVENVLAALGG